MNFKLIYFVKILRKNFWCREKGGIILYKCVCILLFFIYGFVIVSLGRVRVFEERVGVGT